MRKFLRCKIHRATVTAACLEYEGSITIDRSLMDAARILPFEAVDIYNVTSGSRFETYVIPGKPGSGEIQINGAAAHLAREGDVVIIACYGYCGPQAASDHEARLVFVDEENRIKNVRVVSVLGKEKPEVEV